MYLRLQARYNSMRTGKPCGIFAAIYHLEQRNKLTDEEKELYHQTDAWFQENLPNPPFYDDGNSIKGNTWFKEAKAAHMLEKLAPLVQIAESYGVFIDTVRCDTLGEIIYEDEYQVGVV